MLARLPLVDLMVDAVRFNANQGLVDALRMGVPAVTCAGNSMASRLGGSILRAGNLEHAISSSPSDHLQQVIELVATDRGCKGCAPHWLEPGGVSPLFDTPLHVRQWEWAWDHMVQRHRGGFAPAAFDVPLATPWVMDNALPVDG